jgi:uncharacterized membrane-anchored protein
MRRRLFLTVVGLHALLLLGWAGGLEWSRATSTTVLLDVVERDPRDLLRGDFVTLNYAISTLPPATEAALGATLPGQRVWIALAPEGPTWRVATAAPSREALALGPGQRLIVGTLAAERWGGGRRVEYGIERYFVPEGRGTPPRGRMQAEVALSAGGGAQLLRLLVDGHPYP